MSKENEKKMTVHFNTSLGTTKLIFQFFCDAKEGRSFSSFAKDILYAAALAHYNKACNVPVLISTSQGGVVEALGNKTPQASMEEAVVEEDRAQKVQSVKTDIASAAASMFGSPG
jgi:uncharacterized protein with FMN-binding domain